MFWLMDMPNISPVCVCKVFVISHLILYKYIELIEIHLFNFIVKFSFANFEQDICLQSHT